MPFICLANANVPGGVLQITDLWPNVSQHNNPTYPPGQTRYLRRPGTDNAAINSLTGVVEGAAAVRSNAEFEGLAAYLVDRVEPGALQASGVTFTLNGVLATNQIVIKGVVFEFAAGVNDLVHLGTVADPFLVGLGAGDNDAAANLTLALNDAGVAGVMDAIAPLGDHTVATNPGAPSAVVVVSVEDGVAAAVLGPLGDYTLTDGGTGAGGLTIADDAGQFTIGRFVRTNEFWDDTTLAATVAALLNRVDTGLGMTLANANTVLLANAGADLTGTGTYSNSTGSLADLLSILAGRQYVLPTASLKFTAVTAPDTVHVWSATQRGSFTVPNATWDTDMLGGEWGATTAGQKYLKTGGSNVKPTFSGGGDVVNNEIGGARQTYHGTAFAASVANGQLFRYANGVTLFPDADVQAHIAPSLLSKQTRQPTLLNQRVVTVYDDDGTVLV